MLLTEEEALAGDGMLSLETTGEFGEDDFFVYSREHVADWLRVLRNLSLEQQEMLLSYYLLGKTQQTLAMLWCSTQTVCSFRLRMAIQERPEAGVLVADGAESQTAPLQRVHPAAQVHPVNLLRELLARRR